MSPTPDPDKQPAPPSEDDATVRRPVVPKTDEADKDSDTDRSPGKTDRGVVVPRPTEDKPEST